MKHTPGKRFMAFHNVSFTTPSRRCPHLTSPAGGGGGTKRCLYLQHIKTSKEMYWTYDTGFRTVAVKGPGGVTYC